MKHTWKWSALTTLVSISAAALTGCESKMTTEAPLPMSGYKVPDSRSECAVMMKDRDAVFTQDVLLMPGHTGAEHRIQLAGALSELSKILQLANGPVQSPEFTNSIGVIDAATNTANIQSIPRGRMEAVENQSLLAASRAMEEITMRYLFDDAELPPMLEVVHSKIDIATHTQGPMHDLDATDAFVAISSALQKMTTDMVAAFPPLTEAETPVPAPTPVVPAPMPATNP